MKRSTVHRLALIALLTAAATLSVTAQTTPDAAASAQDTEWTRWTSGRYRVTPGDVLEVNFPFVPELNQTGKSVLSLDPVQLLGGPINPL